MEVFIKIGPKDMVKRWLPASLILCFKELTPSLDYQESRFWQEHFAVILYQWRVF